MNIKEKILIELNKKGFPNLKFLFSKEVLKITPKLLNELLEKEKNIFEKILNTKKDKISFDIFEEEGELGYFWSLLNHFQAVDKNNLIDKIIEDFEPKYIDFSNNIAYSKKYYELLNYCLKNTKINKEEEKILKDRIKNFKLRGINLNKDKQETLKKISKKLTKLSQDFTNNIVKDKAEFEYEINKFEKIKNLPKSTLEITKKRAEKKGKKGYLFTADPNEMSDIISYCDDSKIRKLFYKKNTSFASKGNYNNKNIVFEILNLSNEKSKILGYKNFAEVSLVYKMASSPKEVINLLENIFEKAKQKSKDEIKLLKEFFNLKEINLWDLAYYIRLYKEKKYSINTKKLKQYFEFENVLKYLFNLVKNLYQINLKELSIDNYKYNNGIRIYEVYENGRLISYYFLDAFSRNTKRPGAWADNLREKDYINKTIPIIVNVCNFQKLKPGENLMTLSDITTLFHEFGHALHEILSKSKYSELSGFNVEWDFVEVPSQLNENWGVYHKSLVKLSKHYKTGEKIPNEIIQKLRKLKTFMSGNFTIRQCEYALLDMYLYSENPPKNTKELEEKAFKLANKYSYFKKDSDYKMYLTFNHIFGGGYAAGYYSYMRAEIIERDIWEKFKENGIFNNKIVKKYKKTILGAGSIRKAKEMFKDFMGRDIDIKSFFKYKGFEN